MSLKRRRLSAAVSGVLWVSWAVITWAGMTHQVGWGHHLAGEVTRHLAVLVSIFTMLAYLVTPMMATARVWMDIGRREQQRNCTCSHLPRKAQVNADVIPFKSPRNTRT